MHGAAVQQLLPEVGIGGGVGEDTGVVYGERNDGVDGDAPMSYFFGQDVYEVTGCGLATSINGHAGNGEVGGAAGDIHDPAIVLAVTGGLLDRGISSFRIDGADTVEWRLREFGDGGLYEFDPCVGDDDV